MFLKIWQMLLQLGLTTVLVSFILWLGRNFIVSWLTSRIQHEFNKEIEDVKSENRKLEQELKIQAETYKKDIEDISSGALAALNARKITIDQKRLEASELLWVNVVDLDKLNKNANLLQFVKMDALAKSPDKDKLFQGFFDTDEDRIAKLLETKSQVEKVRLYLTQSAWYAFETYINILIYAEINIISTQFNESSEKYMSAQPIRERFAQIFPDFAEDLRQPQTNIFVLMRVLREQILFEALSMREDTSNSEEQIRRANQFRQFAKELKDLGIGNLDSIGANTKYGH